MLFSTKGILHQEGFSEEEAECDAYFLAKHPTTSLDYSVLGRF